MQFLNLDREYAKIDWQSVLAPVFESKQFINGPQVKEFEQAVVEKFDCQYAVGVGSGTAAIELAFLAAADMHTTGLTVLTTPYTFIATTEIPYRLGCHLRFCDIKSDFNIDIDAAKQIIKNEHIDIFLPVHLFGQCCTLDDELIDICRRKGVLIIEDAAQAFGARYNNKFAGTFGDFGCFSFFPSKNLGCAGDGGLVVMKQRSLYEKCLALRNHGASQKYTHILHGGNFRLDTIQAAILLAKLPLVDQFIEDRRKTAALYNKYFVGADDRLIPPQETTGCFHTYNQYVLRVEHNRDAVVDIIGSNNITTMLYYPRSLLKQPCYAFAGFCDSCPQSEIAAEENLALPIAHLTTDETLEVITAVQKAMIYA
jgi:dTDP-4-amino-4,6-dideoxygalactose transaminase